MVRITADKFFRKLFMAREQYLYRVKGKKNVSGEVLCVSRGDFFRLVRRFQESVLCHFVCLNNYLVV